MFKLINIYNYVIFLGKPEGWLVQDAANSQVGRFLHSLAREKGIKTVAIVRREDAAKTVQHLGATKVIVADFKTSEEYTKAIMEATNGIIIYYLLLYSIVSIVTITVIIITTTIIITIIITIITAIVVVFT